MRHDPPGLFPSLIEVFVSVVLMFCVAGVVVFAVGCGTVDDDPADPPPVYEYPTPRERADRCFADGGSSYSIETGCVWTNPEHRATPSSTTTSTTEYDPYGG